MAQMRSDIGLCVPLTGGHNGSWKPTELLVIRNAVLAWLTEEAATAAIQNPLISTAASTTV